MESSNSQGQHPPTPLEALQKAGTFHLSTVEETASGHAPRTRPYGSAMELDGKLAFTTHRSKPTYAQLTANPNVELCAMDTDMTWLRFRGRARFVTSDETRAASLAINPMLAGNYASLGGDFEVFVLEDGEGEYYSLGPAGITSVKVH